MLTNFKQLARRKILKALVVPLRPTHKYRYPLVSFEEYFTWVQGSPHNSGFTRPTFKRHEQPIPFDPWLRKHILLRAKAVKPAVRSYTVAASAEEWKRRPGDKVQLDYFIDEHGQRRLTGDKLDGFVLENDDDSCAPLQWDPVCQVATYSETDMWMWHPLYFRLFLGGN